VTKRLRLRRRVDESKPLPYMPGAVNASASLTPPPRVQHKNTLLWKTGASGFPMFLEAFGRRTVSYDRRRPHPRPAPDPLAATPAATKPLRPLRSRPRRRQRAAPRLPNTPSGGLSGGERKEAEGPARVELSKPIIFLCRFFSYNPGTYPPLTAQTPRPRRLVRRRPRRRAEHSSELNLIVFR